MRPHPRCWSGFLTTTRARPRTVLQRPHLKITSPAGGRAEAGTGYSANSSTRGAAMKAVEEIEALTEAIARRDTKAAVKVCTTHIKNAAKASMRDNSEAHSEHNGHRP